MLAENNDKPIDRQKLLFDDVPVAQLTLVSEVESIVYMALTIFLSVLYLCVGDSFFPHPDAMWYFPIIYGLIALALFASSLAFVFFAHRTTVAFNDLLEAEKKTEPSDGQITEIIEYIKQIRSFTVAETIRSMALIVVSLAVGYYFWTSIGPVSCFILFLPIASAMEIGRVAASLTGWTKYKIGKFL